MDGWIQKPRVLDWWEQGVRVKVKVLTDQRAGRERERERGATLQCLTAAKHPLTTHSPANPAPITTTDSLRSGTPRSVMAGDTPKLM